MLHSVLYPCTLWACAANARSQATSLAQRCCNRPLHCSPVVQWRLEEMHRYLYLSPSLLVPHHANPKGSFKVGCGALREYCHYFPRKVQVPPALSQATREGQAAPQSERTAWPAKFVGLVRTMRPTYISRHRIKMQSYDGTFSVHACSSRSKRGMPAILRRARLYTEATIRRALNDGGATRPGTCTMTVSKEQECVQIQKMRKASRPYASFALFARRRAFDTSLPFVITIVPRCRYLSTTLILCHTAAQALRFPNAPVDL